MAYSSQRSHTGQLDFWKLIGRWQYDRIMWLALRSVKSINVDFLNQLRYFSNHVATQLSSWGWVDPIPDLIHIKIMDPIPDLIHIKIMEVPGIEPATSWLVVRQADP